MAVTRCTYCIVPSVRGTEQSRMPSAIRAEMEQLGQLGYKEVTLLGRNIDAYGRDLPGVTSEGVISIRLQTCSTSTMCAGLSGFGLPPVILVISQSA